MNHDLTSVDVYENIFIYSVIDQLFYIGHISAICCI